MIKPTMTNLIERIEHMSIPEPNTGCWLWLGALGENGYGTIGLGQRKVSAHRASYEAHVGPIPVNSIVLHGCHTKSCVNPDHLSVGTHSDNISDSARKYPDKYRNVSKTALKDRIEQMSTPEPNSGCWLWTANITILGYGEMYVNGRKTLAHRAAYAAFIGEVPKGALVLHSCNMRICVNPEHLEIGGHVDKMRARTVRASVPKHGNKKTDLKKRIDLLSIPEPNTGCCLWLGTVVKSTGYGEIKVDGRKTTAHRAAWIERHGEIPDGLVVMHSCDNRLCVNIDHLSLGSRRDNMKDMARKGRGGFDKLTSEQRRERSKKAQQTLGERGLKLRVEARLEAEKRRKPNLVRINLLNPMMRA